MAETNLRRATVSKCVTCGSAGSLGARFCGNCGGALVEAVDATLQRILTFAFIDLVGSTAAAARTDLEAYDTLLQRYHRICADVIAAFDGKVLELQGDGVLACFGLDTDSENAALAGVAAMLQVLVQVPNALAPLRVRVGMHSGTVLSHATGDYRRPQMTGLNLNVAARIQGLAPPGGLVVSESTLDLLARIAALDTEDLGPTSLKGLDQQVRLFAVTGASVRAIAPEPTSLVERDDILAALAAPPGPAGRTIALIGPAGIGKSAILAEVERRLGDETRVIALSARLNLRHSPLVPFAERLASALGYERYPLLPDSDPAELAERLASFGVPISAERAAILGELLGLADRTGLHAAYPIAQLRELRITSLVEMLADLMEQRPTLLLVDDFHWADPDSLSVIDRLLLRGLPAGAAIILSARPDAEIDALVTCHGIMALRPEPLTTDGSRELVAALGAAELARDDLDHVIALAEGNPLFLRTLVNLLRKVGRRDGALPLSIEATFQGVINSLGSAREFLLLAAVIGRTFRREELTWLAPGREREVAGRLETFARNGIIEREGKGWRFSHILISDAAYHMIPVTRRRSLHQQFAEALAANDRVRATAFPELVADHAFAAEDAPLIARTGVAAGVAMLQRGVFDRAVHYLIKANQALGALPAADPRDRLRALTLLSSASVQRFGFSHPDTRESLRLLEAATEIGGPALLERMIAQHGVFAHRITSGDVRGSAATHRAMGDGARIGGRQHLMIERVNACAQALYRGRFNAVLTAARDVRGLYDQKADGEMFIALGADPLISVMSAEATVAGMFGQTDQVRALTAAAIDHVEAIGAAVHQPWVHVFNAIAFYACAALAESEDHLAIGVALADRQHAAFWSLTGRMWQCVHATDRGARDDDLAELVASADAIGIGLSQPLMRSVLATRRMQAGAAADALTLARGACSAALASGQGMWLTEIWRRRGEIHLALGDRTGAERCIRLALAHARATGAVALARRVDALKDRLASRPVAA